MALRDLPARAWFLLCQTIGRLLRAGTYSTVRIVDRAGAPEVLKRRRWYAPALVRLGGPLMRLLNTGVRVLPQREWRRREQGLYDAVHGAAVRIEDGALILPCLPGRTLAALLDDPSPDASVRMHAITLAVEALMAFHRAGFTHGDAMAENVMIDLEGGAARWFDFETEHDTMRTDTWRRADDVRALLATCALRTPGNAIPHTLHRILDVYADEDVARIVAASFGTVWQRPLIFHLGQAGLSLRRYREIGRLLRDRVQQ